MHPSEFATAESVVGGSGQIGSVAPTIPLDVPTRQETKKAFKEVSSAFQDMSAQHGQIKGGLQVLASTVEALWQAKQGEMETTSQVQETLCRTASMASKLEVRIGEQFMA